MNIRLFFRIIFIAIFAKILLFSINFIHPTGISLHFARSVWLLDWLLEMLLYFLIARDYKSSYQGKPVAIYMYILLSLIMAAFVTLSSGSSSQLTILKAARLLLFVIVAIQLYATRYKAFILFVLLSHAIVAISPLLISHLSQNINFRIYQIPSIITVLPNIILLITLIQLKKDQQQIEKKINEIGMDMNK